MKDSRCTVNPPAQSAGGLTVQRESFTHPSFNSSLENERSTVKPPAQSAGGLTVQRESFTHSSFTSATQSINHSKSLIQINPSLIFFFIPSITIQVSELN